MRKRSAFTLVELLTVVGIIGVLVAITLPAVQNARESGRRVVCSNKIRQLSLAIINYESSNKAFPVGLNSFDVSGASSGRLGMTWITNLLPFLEKNELWEQAIHDYQIDPFPFRTHKGMQTVLQIMVHRGI